MKTIKYSIVFLAISAGLIFHGDLFQDYFSHFYMIYPNISLERPDERTPKDMTQDIYAAATEYGVLVFATDSFNSSPFEITVTIYTTDVTRARDLLKQDCGIAQRSYPSIFFTTTLVRFAELKQVQDAGKLHSFSLIGTSGNLQRFHQTLAENYETGEMLSPISNNTDSAILAACWAIVIALTFLLAWYEVFLRRKEWFVRVSMGERTGNILLRHIASDTICLSLLFTVLFRLLSRFTYVQFQWQLSFRMFALLLLANALPYFFVYRYHWKEAFSNTGGSVSLLSASYMLKLVTAVLAALIVSGNLVMIQEAFSYYRQKSFFQEHNEYYFLDFRIQSVETNADSAIGMHEMSLRRDNVIARLYYRLYKEYFHSADVTTQLPLGVWANRDTVQRDPVTGIVKPDTGVKAPVLYLNQNTRDYLLRHIRSLDAQQLSQEKVYYIFPASLFSQDSVDRQLTEFHEYYGTGDFDAFFTSYKFQYEALLYTGNAELLGVENTQTRAGSYYKNPIVIFSNLDEQQMQIEQEELIIQEIYETESGTTSTSSEGLQTNSSMPSMMFRITPSETEAWITQHGFDPAQDSYMMNNVYEVYQHHWNSMRMILYFNCVLSALLLLLEIIVIITIIRLEYSVNAMELAVKTVLGYSVWQKNKKLFLLTLGTALSGTAAALAVNAIWDISAAWAVLTGSLSLCAAELLMSLFFIRKMERAKIQEILKGASL